MDGRAGDGQLILPFFELGTLGIDPCFARGAFDERDGTWFVSAVEGVAFDDGGGAGYGVLGVKS